MRQPSWFPDKSCGKGERGNGGENGMVRKEGKGRREDELPNQTKPGVCVCEREVSGTWRSIMPSLKQIGGVRRLDLELCFGNQHHYSSVLFYRFRCC